MWNKAGDDVVATALSKGFSPSSDFSYGSTTSSRGNKAIEEGEQLKALISAVWFHVGPNIEHWPTFTKQPSSLGAVFERAKAERRAVEISSFGGLFCKKNQSLTWHHLSTDFSKTLSLIWPADLSIQYYFLLDTAGCTEKKKGINLCANDPSRSCQTNWHCRVHGGSSFHERPTAIILLEI